MPTPEEKQLQDLSERLKDAWAKDDYTLVARLLDEKRELKNRPPGKHEPLDPKSEPLKTLPQSEPVPPAEPPVPKPVPSVPKPVPTAEPSVSKSVPSTEPSAPATPSGANDNDGKTKTELPTLESLQKEWGKAKEAYAKEKDELALREAIERITNGLGKIAAGWHGLNTKTDMSGVKFSESNWDAKRAAAQQDLREALGDIADRRRELRAEAVEQARRAQTDQQHKDLMDYRNRDLDERIRHNKALEGIQDERYKAALLKAVGGKEPEDTLNQKAIDEGRKEITSILSGNTPEDQKKAAVKSVLTSRFKVPPQIAETAVTEAGWLWGRNTNLNKVYDFLGMMTTAAQLPRSPDHVHVYDGEQLGQWPIDDIETAKAQGWLILP